MTAVQGKWKRYRRCSGHSYAFGTYPTLEALRHRPADVLEVLLTSRAEGQGVAKLRAACAAKGIRCRTADRAVRRLSPDGAWNAVCVFAKFRARLDPRANHVVLVQPRYMGNVGTVMRSMVGFGFADLALIRPAPDAFDPRVVRGSMGAIFQVSWSYYDDLDAYRAANRRRLYCFTTDGATRLIDVYFAAPFALVFGSEGTGLPARSARAGETVRIAQTGRVDSLNLATAVGIALHHAAAVTASTAASRAGGRRTRR